MYALLMLAALAADLAPPAQVPTADGDSSPGLSDSDRAAMRSERERIRATLESDKEPLLREVGRVAISEAAPPEPRAEISGDKTIIVGKMARLSAASSRNAVSYRWLVDPEPDDMEVIDGTGPDGQPLKGSELRITHDAAEDTELRVQLIIGGPNGATDVAFSSLMVRPALTTHAAAMAAPAASAISQAPAELAGIDAAIEALTKLHQFTQTLQPQPAAPPLIGMAPGHTVTTQAMAGFPVQNPGNAVNWDDLVKRLALGVKRPAKERAAEAKNAGGCFRSVANQIRTGTLTETDPWTAVSLQAREALGSSYPLWQPFFKELFRQVNRAKLQGLMATLEEDLPFLESAANVLGAL